jgi:hypothetical protein
MRAQQIADEMRAVYGGMLNVEQMKRELGVKDRRTAEKFLQGVPFVIVNKRKHWRVNDIARRIYDQEEIPC